MAPIIEVSEEYMNNLDSNRYTRRFDLEANVLSSRPSVQSSEFKYLKGKSGNKFSRVDDTPEGSYWKVFNKQDSVAQYDFCGNLKESLAKRIFHDDICDIVSGGYMSGGNSIRTTPGKIKYVNDEWVVTEKVKVYLK